MNAPKPRTGTLHNRMEPRVPRCNWCAQLDAQIARENVQAERLRAELDDDAAVAAWLSGGAK